MGWAEARLAAPVVGGGGAGGFVVDPERAEACIAELSRIVNDLRLQAMMQTACAFDAPGYDDVSLNLAVNGRVMAQRAEQFVRAWADQIEVTRDALRRQLDGYSTTEDANRRLL